MIYIVIVLLMFITGVQFMINLEIQKRLTDIENFIEDEFYVRKEELNKYKRRNK